MRSTPLRPFALPTLAALALAGCAAAEVAPPQPAPMEAPAEEVVAERPPEPEPDTPSRDRWLAPFAVSSAGRVSPPRPRDVTVIGAAPAIAEGLAANDRAAPERREEPAPSPAREPQPAPQDEQPAPVSPVPAPSRSAEEAPAASRPGTHLVARGDTWFGIANRYRISARDLAAANPGVDPERIRIGQTLRVPGAEAPPSAVTHRVGPGDTLWGIARRYNVSVEQIRRANGMTDDRVRLGQTLRIPDGADR